MKLSTYIFFMIIATTLMAGCLQSDKVKVTVKQIIPLPTGTIIEIAAPLETNQSFDTLLPRTGDNIIYENASFVIPIEISNGNEDYSNTSISLFYQGEYVEFLYPYSSSKKPLEQIENNSYIFDNDLKASQTTQLLLVGRVKSLPTGVDYAGISFNVTIYDGNNATIAGVSDKIRIEKTK